MFVITDIETTGLDRQHDFVLEIGMIATDDNLDEIDSVSYLIQPAPIDVLLDAIHSNEVVHQMHSENGIIGELVRGEGWRPALVEQMLCDWYDNTVGEVVPMGGSNVSFDREFLHRVHGVLESKFHYRNIDVSTVKELVRRFRPDLAWTPPEVKAHRALADCRQTIAELKHYRDALFIERSIDVTPFGSDYARKLAYGGTAAERQAYDESVIARWRGAAPVGCIDDNANTDRSH